jgi:hypothetical protein
LFRGKPETFYSRSKAGHPPNMGVDQKSTVGSQGALSDGSFQDNVGLSVEVPEGSYYNEYVIQTFTISIGNKSYNLGTEFYHYSMQVHGYNGVTVGVLVP